MTLDDNDPIWEQHDGGSGHRDQPEWSADDGRLADEFHAITRGRARSLLDLLIDHPGEQLDADWLADRIAGDDADGLAKRQLVARAFRDMSPAQTASGRRYPFYWWRGINGSPTEYAMKPTVAALFPQTRNAGDGDEADGQTHPDNKGDDWSAAEVKAIIDDYLTMLVAEVASQPYSKAEHRRALLPRLNPGRTAPAVEWKHRNISAAMADLGLAFIRGYMPAPNKQGALTREIQRRLEADPSLLAAIHPTSERSPAREELSADDTAEPRTDVATKQNSHYWWDGESGENVYMEITRRDDIGADLKAPSVARGGGVTPGYALVSVVRQGDVIVHYDSRDEEIVGVSVVTGAAEPAPIYWVARGTYARRAGEQARWLPGIRVPLGQYQELKQPVTLADIRARKDELLELRRLIQARADGKAIYFPWIPYQDTLRTFQSYLAKMPKAAISLFPQLRAAVELAYERSSGVADFSPVEQAEDAVEQAAGRSARRGRGQGFQLDQEAKVAVEAHAMNAAAEYFSSSWNVQDVHGNQSYDLVCRRGDEEMRVEVKGTTTDGTEVILTPNEVTHARSYPHTALFILSDIKLERAEEGIVAASGGSPHVFDPWHIDNGTLKPVGFRYQPATA